MMVHDLGLLVRVRLRLLLRSAGSRYTRGAKRAAPFRLIVVVLIVAWVLVTLVGPAAFLLTSFLSTPAGRAAFGTVLTLASSGITFVMIFYAFVTLMGMMTYRSDLGLLLLAPISPRLVMTEKLGSVSLGFTPLLLLLVPALLGAGHVLHLGVLYDVSVVLFVLLVPVLPVSLAMLLVLPLLRYLPPARARTVSTVLAMSLGAAIFIGSQLLASPGRPTTGAPSFPTLPAVLPSTWPGRMLAAVAAGQVGTGILYLLATLVLSAAVFALAVLLSSRALETGSASYHEVGRHPRRRLPDTPRRRTYAFQSFMGSFPSRPSVGWQALIAKEWRVLRRDPTRLMQLGYPLILVAFYWYRGLVSPSLPPPSGNSISIAGILPVVILLLVSSWMFINALAPSIVNREGPSLYLLAQAPLSPRDILLAKWSVCVIPVVLLVEALLLGSAVIHQLPAIPVVLIGLTFLGLITALTGVMLCCTLLWPRLQADNPRRQASGVAVLVGSVGELIVAGAVFGLLAVALAFWDSSPIVAGAALASIVIVVGLVLLVVLFAGSRLMQRVLYRASGDV